MWVFDLNLVFLTLVVVTLTLFVSVKENKGDI